MMAPFQELAPMTAEEALARRIKINHAIQWVWRGVVIVILLFQIVNLLIQYSFNKFQAASQQAQSDAIKYLVDVTVDRSSIDPKSGVATPWIVEIYRRLSDELEKNQLGRAKMLAQMQAYTDLGEARQKRNEELVREQKDNTALFGSQLESFKESIESDLAGERADRESWAKALLNSMTKVEKNSATVREKVQQRIINPSDVAPVIRRDRILERQNRRLKQEKTPVVKLWPWQH